MVSILYVLGFLFLFPTDSSIKDWYVYVIGSSKFFLIILPMPIYIVFFCLVCGIDMSVIGGILGFFVLEQMSSLDGEYIFLCHIHLPFSSHLYFSCDFISFSPTK